MKLALIPDKYDMFSSIFQFKKVQKHIYFPTTLLVPSSSDRNNRSRFQYFFSKKLEKPLLFNLPAKMNNVKDITKLQTWTLLKLPKEKFSTLIFSMQSSVTRNKRKIYYCDASSAYIQEQLLMGN